MFKTRSLFFLFIWPLLSAMVLYNIPSNLANFPADVFKAPYSSRLLYSYYSNTLLLPRLKPARPFLRKYCPELSFMAIQKFNQLKEAQATNTLADFVQYEAQDSITFDLVDKNFTIYGVGKITYEDMSLEAEKINFNWNNNTVTATGKQTETGEIAVKSMFTQGKTKYIAEEIRYSLDSKRGTARKLITKQDEAILKCNKAKMDTQDSYYADKLYFTTCNLVKPHYYIKAKTIKFIRDNQIESGPFHFYFNDVPTPLGFFYGLFFIPRNQKSGVIPPKLGEEAINGFYLKDGGYYIYFNDYIDLALRGSLYSKGSSAMSLYANYKNRYGYQGNIGYEQQVQAKTPELALQELKEKSWRFIWNHATLNNRRSSFTAGVNISSKAFQQNSFDENDRLKAVSSSSIKYTNNLSGFPYILSTNIAYARNFQNNLNNLLLPELVVTTDYIYPFRRKINASKSWHQSFYFKHIFEFKNQLTNVIGLDTLDLNTKNLPEIFRKAKYGIQHTIPVEINIKVFRHFNLNPKFQYQERWYWTSLNYTYDGTNDSVSSATVKGFQRVWDYKFDVNLQTDLYAVHTFGSDWLIQAFRHQLVPSISFSYTPDFSKEKFGYWQKILTPKGEKIFNRFENFVYGSPQSSAKAVLNFKLDNTLEIKVKNTEEPEAKPHKIPILESLILESNYDFLKKSFKLNDLKLTARTRVIDSLISVEYNAAIDPYYYQNKKRIHEFAWQHGQGIGYLKTSSVKISTRLKSSHTHSALQEANNTPSKIDKKNHSVLVDSAHYVDFNIPWQVNLTFESFYQNDIERDTKTFNTKLRLEGDINITKKWKIGFNGTYDIDNKKFVGSVTKLTIYRDLHCWQMNFDWRPFGERQSYEFSIGLKAPMFQDIRYPRSNAYKKL